MQVKNRKIDHCTGGNDGEEIVGKNATPPEQPETHVARVQCHTYGNAHCAPRIHLLFFLVAISRSLSLSPHFSCFYAIHTFAWIHSAVKVHAHRTVKRNQQRGSTLSCESINWSNTPNSYRSINIKTSETPLFRSNCRNREPFAPPCMPVTKKWGPLSRRRKNRIEWAIAGGQHMSVKQVLDNRKARRIKCGPVAECWTHL